MLSHCHCPFNPPPYPIFINHGILPERKYYRSKEKYLYSFFSTVNDTLMNAAPMLANYESLRAQFEWLCDGCIEVILLCSVRIGKNSYNTLNTVSFYTTSYSCPASNAVL